MVRAAFVRSLIGAAEEYEGNGVFRHSATFLVEPGSDNDKQIEAAFKAEAQAVWPKKAQAMLDSLRPQTNKCCYQKGDLKEYDGFEGMMALTGHRKATDGRPLLLDSMAGDDGKPAKLIGSDGKFYPGKEGRIYGGCFVNATVEIYAQDGKNPGLRCSLLGVQFAKDGDSFGGASKGKEDDFEVIDAPETEDELG
jgi:hypothetical protein